MKRRTILARAGLIFPIGLSGCLNTASTNDEEGEETGTTGSNRNTETEMGGIAKNNNQTTGYDRHDNQIMTENCSKKEEPRIDEPSHKIEQPDSPESSTETEVQEGWDEEYLGEHMKTEPSLLFGSLKLKSDPLKQNISNSAKEFQKGFIVKLIDNDNERNDIFDMQRIDEETRKALKSPNLEESVLIVVETGIVSSSVNHRWVRVEGSDEEIHLHGYYTDPYEKLDDRDTIVSVIEIDRPNPDIDIAQVSLTVDVDRRIHFNSCEGLVTVS